VSPTPSAVAPPGQGRARLAGRIRAARIAGAVIVIVTVLLAPAAWASTGGGWLTELAAPACASAAGATPVGLVVDFGTVDGGPARVSRHCVTLTSGGNGFDLLKADGHTFRVDSAGLVCAIDGYPASGCGQHTASGYRYWSFWHAEAADPGVWHYANFGPASHRPAAGSVEGWHYVEGAGNPSDPPPGASASSPCPTDTPTPTPTVAPPVTAAPATGTGPGGAGSGASPGAPAPGDGSGSGSLTGTGAASGATTDSTVDDADVAMRAGAELDQPGSETGTGGDGRGDTGRSADGSDQQALGASSPAASGRDAGSGVPVAVIVVVVAIVALGGAAVVRSRIRPDA